MNIDTHRQIILTLTEDEAREFYAYLDRATDEHPDANASDVWACLGEAIDD